MPINSYQNPSIGLKYHSIPINADHYQQGHLSCKYSFGHHKYAHFDWYWSALSIDLCMYLFTKISQAKQHDVKVVVNTGCQMHEFSKNAF